MAKAKDRDYLAFQTAAGQQSAFMLKLLKRRDELGISPEEFHVLFTDDGDPYIDRLLVGLKAPAAEAPKPKTYLRQLYADKTIIIDPTGGTRTIAQAKEVFVGGIDSDFRNWNLDVSAQPTEATKVDVHELVENGTFEEVYGSLGRPLKELCLTQDQIIGFCVKNKDKLRRDGYATFFLFEVDGNFFVARVGVPSGGDLFVYVFRVSYDRVWSAGYRRRFVIPQLTPGH